MNRIVKCSWIAVLALLCTLATMATLATLATLATPVAAADNAALKTPVVKNSDAAAPAKPGTAAASQQPAASEKPSPASAAQNLPAAAKADQPNRPAPVAAADGKNSNSPASGAPATALKSDRLLVVYAVSQPIVQQVAEVLNDVFRVAGRGGDPPRNVADVNGNSIVAYGTRKEHDEIKSIIKLLDVPQPGPGDPGPSLATYNIASVDKGAAQPAAGSSAAAPTTMQLAVYRLRYAPAGHAVTLLNRVVGRERGSDPLRMRDNVVNNSIIVLGKAEKIREVADLLSLLEGAWSKHARTTVAPKAKSAEPKPPATELKVFSLKYAQASDLMPVLQILDDEERLVIGVDQRTNSLIVRGSPDALREIEALLLRLDTQESARAETGAAPGGTKPASRPLAKTSGTPSESKAGSRPPEASHQDSSGNGGFSSESKAGSRPPEAPATQLKIFRLGTSRAADAMAVLKVLYSADRRGPFDIAADERTNCLIVRGPTELLRQIEALLMRLDKQESARTGAATGDAGTAARPASASPRTTPEDPAALDRLVTDRSRQYGALEQEAARLAEECRKVSPGSPAKASDDLLGRLRAKVAEAFEGRQELQQLEVARLRTRLARIEGSLRTRERIKDAIVAHRVKELLEPGLPWTPPGEEAAVTAKPGATNAGRGGSAAGQKVGGVDLVVTGPQKAAVSDRVEFSVQVTNNGPQMLPDVMVRSHFDPALRPVRDRFRTQGERWSLARDGHLAWRIPQLAPNQPQRLTFELVCQQASPKASVRLSVTAAAEVLAQESKSIEIRAAGDAPGAAAAPAKPAEEFVNPFVLRPSSSSKAATADADPLIVLGASDGVRLFDSPHAFQEKLAAAIARRRNAETQTRWLLEEAPKNSPDETPEEIKKRMSTSWDALEAANKAVDFLRNEYATQVRLLELDVQQATEQYKAADSALRAARGGFDVGRATASDVQEKESAVQAARVRVQQREAILDLYRKIPDAQPEPTKPEPPQPTPSKAAPPKLHPVPVLPRNLLEKAETIGNAAGERLVRRLGLELRPVGRESLAKSSYSGGLLVVAVREGSPAAEVGLRVGDILVGLDRWATTSLANVAWAVSQYDSTAVRSDVDTTARQQPEKSVKFIVLRGEKLTHGHIRIQRSGEVDAAAANANTDSVRDVRHEPSRPVGTRP